MNWKSALHVVLIGQIVGHVSGIAHGYLAAIAIPVEYFKWFDTHLHVKVGMVLLDAAQLFLGTGLLIFIVAFLITGSLSNPLKHCLVFYASVEFYFIVTIAVIYGQAIYWPTYIFSYYGIAKTVPIIMLFLAYKLRRRIDEVKEL